MSVLIKGMEMPKNCAECEFHQSGYPDWCDLSIRARDIHNTEIRQEWCPLVEVPTPHGQLIDADEIIEVQMFDEMYEEWTLKTMSVAEYLASAADMPPTIIKAEEGEEDE